jgi:hypothetical protein
MSTTIHVVYIDAAEQLVHQMILISQGHADLASQHAVIGVWMEKPNLSGEGPLWIEFSGNSVYAVERNTNGMAITKHDTTPGTFTAVRQFNDTDDWDAQRIVDPKVASAAIGKGSNWDVFENGEGAVYEGHLASARTLVRIPT